MTLETTTRRPVLVDATPPDDSRDCCRAAQQIMGDGFHDAKSLVDDTLALIFSALMDDDAPAETLRRFIGDAQSAMARVSADLDRIGALVRHGTGDLRKIDAMLAARAQALDEGRDADPLLVRMSDDMAATMRDMLAREAEYRPLRTPEAVAERRALYDRLEVDLTAREVAAQPVKPAHVVRAEADLIAAEKRAGAAEAALFGAPVLTIEDAARKLQHAVDSHMDPGDYSTELVASALAGLRSFAGTA